MQVRRPPRRSCVACRCVSDKRELVRVVRTPAGPSGTERVEVDPTGKRAGRGAYLCRRFACWEAALKKGRLDAALKTKIGVDDRIKLVEFATSLNEAVAV